MCRVKKKKTWLNKPWCFDYLLISSSLCISLSGGGRHKGKPMMLLCESGKWIFQILNIYNLQFITIRRTPLTGYKRQTLGISFFNLNFTLTLQDRCYYLHLYIRKWKLRVTSQRHSAVYLAMARSVWNVRILLRSPNSFPCPREPLTQAYTHSLWGVCV